MERCRRATQTSARISKICEKHAPTAGAGGAGAGRARFRSGASAGTDLATGDPGNTGSFVSEGIETATKVTGNNYGPRSNYGAASNFANTCGLIFQREAAGVVETIGPQVQVTSGDVSVVYQGDVILGRLAMGADFVNPAACVELFAGTTTKPAAFNN